MQILTFVSYGLILIGVAYSLAKKKHCGQHTGPVTMMYYVLAATYVFLTLPSLLGHAITEEIRIARRVRFILFFLGFILYAKGTDNE